MTVTDRIFAVWDAGTPAAAEAQFRSILSTDADSLSARDAGELRTQLARSVGLQGRFDEARALLDEAAAGAEALQAAGEGAAALHVRVRLERGRVLNSSGHAAQAAAHFQAALELASAPRTGADGAAAAGADALLAYLAVDALHMLAIVSADAAGRRAFAERALALAAGSADVRTRAWAGALLNNLGWDAVDAGRVSDAVGLFRRAADVRKEALDRVADAPGEAPARLKAFTAWKIAVWSVGHALLLEGEKDAALETLNGLLAAGADGPFIREDLAVIYSGSADSVAAEHAQKALDLGVTGKSAEKMSNIIAQFRPV